MNLEPCPTSGEGVHKWILSSANHLWYESLAPASVEAEIKARMTRPPSPSNEVWSAVEKVFNERGARNGNGFAGSAVRPVTKPKPKWPERISFAALRYDPEAFTVENLADASPIKFEDGETHTEGILAALFGVDGYICVSRKDNSTERLVDVSAHYMDLPEHLHEWEHVVPSRMKGESGTTKAGKPGSPRALDNVGPRVFLVHECDDTSWTKNHQVAAIKYLSAYAPLVMVVDSGGKSLHAWFHVEGRPEAWCRQFFGACVALGADDAAWTLNQKMRLPDGTRHNNGKRQQIVYYDPLNIDGNDIFKRGRKSL